MSNTCFLHDMLTHLARQTPAGSGGRQHWQGTPNCGQSPAPAPAAAVHAQHCTAACTPSLGAATQPPEQVG